MPRECRLLAGPAALSAQVLLAIIALLGLFYKRCAVAAPGAQGVFDPSSTLNIVRCLTRAPQAPGTLVSSMCKGECWSPQRSYNDATNSLDTQQTVPSATSGQGHKVWLKLSTEAAGQGPAEVKIMSEARRRCCLIYLLVQFGASTLKITSALPWVESTAQTNNLTQVVL